MNVSCTRTTVPGTDESDIAMIDESFKDLLHKIEEDLKTGKAYIFPRPCIDDKDTEKPSQTDFQISSNRTSGL